VVQRNCNRGGNKKVLGLLPKDEIGSNRGTAHRTALVKLSLWPRKREPGRSRNGGVCVEVLQDIRTEGQETLAVQGKADAGEGHRSRKHPLRKTGQ